MGDTKLSQLGALSPAQLTDLFYMIRGSVFGKLSASDLLALSSRRNLLINGACDIDQRNGGAAVNEPGINVIAYVTDRLALFGTGAACAAQRVAVSSADFPGFRFGVKLQRTPGSANVGAPTLVSIMETSDAVRLAGQKATFSLSVKAGANFSGAGVRLVITTATGIDQAASTVGTGMTGGINQIDITTALAPGAVARRVHTITVPANCTQIGWVAQFTPTGTAGADDSITITGFQMEPGDQASPFEFRPTAQEWAMCRRYCRSYGGNDANEYVGDGCAISGTQAEAVLSNIDMRVTPSLVLSAAGDWSVGNSAAIACASLILANSSPNVARLVATVGGGLTTGQGTFLRASNTTNARLRLEAEL